ncbi:MAG: hypothetical protein ACHBN1_19435 [Heteroscytonema crispum UTEX LB 1556]
MKPQILSLAIALPMIMANAASSYAGEIVQVSQQNNATVSTQTLISVDSRLSNPEEDLNRPGEGVKPPKPPRPRKSGISLNGKVNIVAPAVNVIPQNLNIRNVDSGL